MRLTVLGILVLGVLLMVTNHGAQAKSELRSELQIFKQLMRYVLKQQTFFDQVDFQKMVEIMAFSQYIFRNSFQTFTLDRQSITCVTCRSGVDVFIQLRREGKSEEEIAEVAIDFCILLNLQTERVCKGAIELNLPIFIYMIDNVPEFSSHSFCGVLLQTNDKNFCQFNDERYEWTVDIPPKKSLEHTKLEKSGEIFKIVHLSDIHYDPAYKPGGVADCDEPMCCRAGQTQKASPKQRGLYNEESLKGRVVVDSDNNYFLNLDYAETVREARMKGYKKNSNRYHKSAGAGYWGDYRSCDTPWWAVEDAVDHVIENHPSFDYVYYTGDTVDHGVWETTYELITNSIVKTTDKLYRAFGDTPVYQVIGNHESQPTNQFAPYKVTEGNMTTSWLYDLLWEQWKRWLPAEAEHTLKKGGYYTALVKPGFRVIVLNANLCYRYNWWVEFDPRFSREQLTWMVEVLTEAEANSEKVHILSHIPAGTTDCLAVYTREYKRIIERFADTITGEFNGHTHNDEFKMFYTKEDGKPILTAWNGGSLTAYSDVNPNYRLYDIDASTFEVVDLETWVCNLTEANLTPKRPKWFKEYSFKEKFNVPSLSPEDMDRLLERLVTVDQDLLVTDYHRLRGKSSDPYYNWKCDDNCVKDNLVYLLVSELYDNKKYEEMSSKFMANKPTKKL